MTEDHLQPECGCSTAHRPKRIVLTGGPGAGKTALLEMVRRTMCRHVRILPEAASVVFGGGFPRENGDAFRRAAQRAIFHVQRELEVTGELHRPAIVLCDRGTLDGVAYWPGPVNDFWTAVGESPGNELRRYDAVIHLRTPAPDQGYNHVNPLRVESADAAAVIDGRIGAVWREHPSRYVVAATHSFLEKARSTLAILHSELPDCCALHLERSLGPSHVSGPPVL